MAFDAPTQEQLEERRGVRADALVWLTARNPQTGLPESIGFWTGEDHRVLTVEGQSRLYYAAVMDVPPIVSEVGLRVQYHRVILPPLTPAVRQALRVYDAQQAACEIHTLPFDIDTGQPRTPVRLVRGWVENAPEAIDGIGGGASVELRIASDARRLTQGVPLYRSDAAQQQLHPGDRGREYVDTAHTWEVPWDTR